MCDAKQSEKDQLHTIFRIKHIKKYLPDNIQDLEQDITSNGSAMNNHKGTLSLRLMSKFYVNFSGAIDVANVTNTKKELVDNALGNGTCVDDNSQATNYLVVRILYVFRTEFIGIMLKYWKVNEQFECV
eukprot:68750_1